MDMSGILLFVNVNYLIRRQSHSHNTHHFNFSLIYTYIFKTQKNPKSAFKNGAMPSGIGSKKGTIAFSNSFPSLKKKKKSTNVAILYSCFSFISHPFHFLFLVQLSSNFLLNINYLLIQNYIVNILF